MISFPLEIITTTDYPTIDIISLCHHVTVICSEFQFETDVVQICVVLLYSILLLRLLLFSTVSCNKPLNQLVRHADTDERSCTCILCNDSGHNQLLNDVRCLLPVIIGSSASVSCELLSLPFDLFTLHFYTDRN